MKKIFCFLLMIVALNVSATVYHISPSGNDATGDGSIGNPWRTLYKATSTVTTAGDFIHVYSGVYLETLQCDLAPGVSIEGDGITSILQSTLTTQFVPLLRLLSTTEGTNGNQSVSYLKFDGRSLTTSWAISVVARSNVSIHHCTIINFQESGVVFTGITAPIGDGEPSVYSTGNSFHDNIVSNCATNNNSTGFKYGRGNLQFGGQIGMMIYNNDIQQPYRTGSSTDDIGWPIKYATGGFTKDCKVYNNILKRAVFSGSCHGCNNDWNFSFEMWNTQNLEMNNNEFQGEVDIVNATKGIYQYGLKFRNNKVSYPALSTYFQSGLRLETDEQDIIIDSCLFENMEQAITWSPHDYPENPAVTGIYVYRNLIKRCRFKNIGVSGGTANSCIRFEGTEVDMRDIKFYNNTLISAGGGGTFFGLVFPNYANNTVKDVDFNNNIVTGFSTAVYITTLIDSLKIKNNCLYSNGADTFFSPGETATHYTNSGNINSNPLIVADSLSTGSPCIDSGIDVGLPFSGAAPDMGPREFGTVVLPPPPAPVANGKLKKRIK